MSGMDEPEGWYADESDPDESGRGLIWQPHLRTGDGVDVLDHWFDTEEECTRYIRERVLGRGMLGG